MNVGIDPHWRIFGKTKAAAMFQLTTLAERLGCRNGLSLLDRPGAMSLARGAPDILAAAEVAGGVRAFAAADPAAAAFLCHGLMQAVGDPRRLWLPGNMRRRVEDAFAVLGPTNLKAAAAGLRDGVPGAPTCACSTIRLTHAFLQKPQEIEVAAVVCQVGRQPRCCCRHGRCSD